MESYFSAKRPAVRDPAGGRGRRHQRGRSPRRRSRPPSRAVRSPTRSTRPPTSGRSADVLARGPVVRGAHAAGHVPRALAARRPPERLQHPRGLGRRDGARTCRSPPSRPA
jgi:hypothetical protein